MWDWYVTGGWNDATIAKGTARSEADAAAEVIRCMRTYKQVKRGGGSDRYGPGCFHLTQADLQFSAAVAGLIARVLQAS